MFLEIIKEFSNFMRLDKGFQLGQGIGKSGGCGDFLYKMRCAGKTWGILKYKHYCVLMQQRFLKIALQTLN